MENNTQHIAVWFELPSTQFDRAVAFYQQILGVTLEEMDIQGMKLGLFPHDDLSAVSGAIIFGEGFKPSSDGSIVYLNGGEDLAIVLAKVEDAGGKVLIPKTHLGDDIGYIAHFIDTEGNRVGLHSML